MLEAIDHARLKASEISSELQDSETYLFIDRLQ